jgi:hypothetical protein
MVSWAACIARKEARTSSRYGSSSRTPRRIRHTDALGARSATLRGRAPVVRGTSDARLDRRESLGASGERSDPRAVRGASRLGRKWPSAVPCGADAVAVPSLSRSKLSLAFPLFAAAEAVAVAVVGAVVVADVVKLSAETVFTETISAKPPQKQYPQKQYPQKQYPRKPQSPRGPITSQTATRRSLPGRFRHSTHIAHRRPRLRTPTAPVPPRS